MSKHAKITVEVKPATGPNGEDAVCNCHIEGSVNSLLNAYLHMSTHIFKEFMEDLGKDETLMLYSHVQMNVLENLGINAEKEAKRAEKELRVLKAAKALEGILGKTFTMPEEGAE